ncbi:MAG TPA: RsmE family RNA methyltransferase [Candidatus Limnocylindria bacterium]|nr:RsmE family RNA methyltransferase [Candidatus Limnocylindria bacterium]
MNRFFVDDIAGNRIALPPNVVHQARRVLRLRDADPLLLLDGRGGQARCRLDGDEAVVEERTAAGGEPRHRLEVCQALIKGDRLEQVVQHGTEIGIAAFRLIVTERCVVRELSPRKVDRLRAIAREAAEQSERGVVPAVHGPLSLAEVLVPSAVLLYERQEGLRLSELPPPDRLIIGPEGGFSAAEVAQAQRAGAMLAGLGPRILRSESVALAAAAVVLAKTGDFA